MGVQSVVFDSAQFFSSFCIVEEYGNKVKYHKLVPVRTQRGLFVYFALLKPKKRTKGNTHPSKLHVQRRTSHSANIAASSKSGNLFSRGGAVDFATRRLIESTRSV